ncbi:MAG: multiheme c-type cytochrome [Acidiferrobacteraceae bacterium]
MTGILLVGIAVAGVLYLHRRTAYATGVIPGNDTVARFLKRHWAYPLAPEGSPPGNYSSLTASLAPASCGRCHRKQYDDWRTSLHSHSVGPGLLWQFRIMNQMQTNKCMRCHAPLAEQKALAAREFRWPGHPSSPLPTYVSPDLFRRGLICAGCHVRHHRRFGPPPLAGMPSGDKPGLPHGGFTSSKAFLDSRFCAGCHQFPADGPGLNGKLFEDTYREWRASRFAAEGVSCQSCHMPNRRHLWRGIHDPAMVRQGLDISLVVKRESKSLAVARAVIRSKAIGHDFPTYLVPKVKVTLYRLDPDGGSMHVLARRIIGRTVDATLTRETADTRIPPGGSSALTTHFATTSSSLAKVGLRIDVAPEEHYERMIRYEMGQAGKYDRATLAVMRDALSGSVATRYRLVRLVASIPSRTGQSIRKVAN